jgi:putative toxin-antitoxin system antitoxin component (TIGR02293 family)
MVQQVRTGFKPTTLDALATSLGVGQEQAIALLNLPRSTIKRQQSEGRSFSPDISDRLYRARKLLDVSRETIGDDAAAVRWLQRAHPALGGVTALSLVDTTVGYERVLDELQRIANGVAA